MAPCWAQVNRSQRVTGGYGGDTPDAAVLTPALDNAVIQNHTQNNAVIQNNTRNNGHGVVLRKSYSAGWNETIIQHYIQNNTVVRNVKVVVTSDH